MLLVICTRKVTKNNRNDQEKQREDKKSVPRPARHTPELSCFKTYY